MFYRSKHTGRIYAIHKDDNEIYTQYITSVSTEAAKKNVIQRQPIPWYMNEQQNCVPYAVVCCIDICG